MFFFYFIQVFIIVRYSSMDKVEVKAIVNDEIKKFIGDSLDKEIKKILRNGNTASRDEIANIVKDAFDTVFRTLWVKKDFWRNNIK